MYDVNKLIRYTENILINNKFNKIHVRRNLILVTGAVESHLGEYQHQIGSNVAQGFLQIEKTTYDEIYQIYHKRYPLKGWAFIHDPDEQILAGSLIYKRGKDPLPENNLEGLWGYYKKYFNSYLGATTKEKFINAYNTYLAEYNIFPTA